MEGVKFSAVLKSVSKMWVVSYITGSSLHYFKRNIAEAYLNFNHVWESRFAPVIAQTIPFVNNEAEGYQPGKLAWQIDLLRVASRNAMVNWTEKERIKALLT